MAKDPELQLDLTPSGLIKALQVAYHQQVLSGPTLMAKDPEPQLDRISPGPITVLQVAYHQQVISGKN